ncbi:MAG: (5-formylfuran-3-yl)methyl phosphate synthase [Candidatus Lokiarchaeia archaeon]|nr:(5-formylfuran-3-yl)methyl phosphate synthase [Candidatus Lokiarchaeia archaeon]
MSNKIRLLISPKTIEEAKIIVANQIDYIDCKNPEEGSLGANFPWIISEMKKLIPPESPQLLSATIGDFPNLPGSASLAALGAAVSGADIIKVGLKGPNNERTGIQLMKKVVKAVKDYNTEIKVVVAGYADRIRMKSSPEFMSIPSIALESGADIAMLDTFIKDKKGLFDFLSKDQLVQFKEKAKESNLEVALAGNLRKKDIPLLIEISPDIIGVRSVVCEGYDRLNGCIKSELIEDLKSELFNNYQENLNIV